MNRISFIQRSYTAIQKRRKPSFFFISHKEKNSETESSIVNTNYPYLGRNVRFLYSDDVSGVVEGL